ncbi:hypothetical protein KP509_1Z106900 [Ceratopteris richardii]|nr:hypothetical protein KP509_1Z106900 [Ceratopteris richardii]
MGEEFTQYYVLSCFLLHLFFYHAVLAESQSSTPAEGSEQDEKQRDFMAWIERVDSRYYSGTLSRPMDSDDELAASKAVGGVITVGGSGAQFSKVQDAVDAVSPGNGQRIVIQIAAGVYKEKVHVPSNKPYITFQGAGAGSTTITWQDTLASAGTLAKSATVGIDARGFIAKGISFVNSSPPPPIGSKNRQAVALRISGDQAAFYNCNFLSSQDTLYDDEGRHYFEGCLIQGSVDFICGNGQSLYKGCELRAVQRSTESLTAQRRSSPNENTGFSFVNCKVTGEGMAYLGRAWGEYSRVIFSYTYMANVVKPVGWYNWGDSSRENKVFYGQYKCSGPGADESKRVGWSKELTDAQAAPFQTVSFIDGSSWLQS